MTDLDVADSFLSEAQACLNLLRKPSAIVTSPLKRCALLAQYLADAFRLPLKYDARLKEMDFGTWENTPWNAVPRQQLDDWAQDFTDARPHGGESVRMLYERAQAALNEIDALNRDTLVVTHNGVIKCALAKGPSQDDMGPGVDYGSALCCIGPAEQAVETAALA